VGRDHDYGNGRARGGPGRGGSLDPHRALNEGGHTPEPERVPRGESTCRCRSIVDEHRQQSTIIGVDGRPGLDSAVICRAALEEHSAFDLTVDRGYLKPA